MSEVMNVSNPDLTIMHMVHITLCKHVQLHCTVLMKDTVFFEVKKNVLGTVRVKYFLWVKLLGIHEELISEQVVTDTGKYCQHPNEN